MKRERGQTNLYIGTGKGKKHSIGLHICHGFEGVIFEQFSLRDVINSLSSSLLT